MALLAATVLEDAVIMAQKRMTDHENRITNTDAVAMFAQGVNSLVDAATFASLRASARRPVKIPVLQRLDTPVRTVRQINESPTMATSAFVTPTWQTVGFAVGRQEAVNADNAFEASVELSHQITSGIRKVVTYIDDLCVDVLDTAKYATPPASALTGVTVASGAYEMSQAKFYANLPAIMEKLDILGPYSILSNVEALAQITEMGTYQTYNQVNLAKLYEGYNIGYSSNIAPEDNYIQKSYVLPNNSVGMLQWTEFDARQGRDYDLLKYFEMPISFTTKRGQNITLNFGVRYAAGSTDLSAKLSGLERAFAETWGLYVDIAFVTQYSSDSTSPIVKFNIPQPV